MLIYIIIIIHIYINKQNVSATTIVCCVVLLCYLLEVGGVLFLLADGCYSSESGLQPSRSNPSPTTGITRETKKLTIFISNFLRFSIGIWAVIFLYSFPRHPWLLTFRLWLLWETFTKTYYNPLCWFHVLGTFTLMRFEMFIFSKDFS